MRYRRSGLETGRKSPRKRRQSECVGVDVACVLARGADDKAIAIHDLHMSFWGGLRARDLGVEGETKPNDMPTASWPRLRRRNLTLGWLRTH